MARLWCSRRWAVLGLVGAVALAVGVRLVHLASDPLWYDEAATLGIASMSWAIVFGPMAEVESSPPGYYALAKLWSMAFGDDVVTVRVLSVLAGAAALVPLWRLGRAGFGPRAAWLAALLLALAASHVRLSQDARGYSVLFLCTAMGMYSAWRLVEAVRTERGGLLASLSLGGWMAAMLWIHPTASIIATSLNAFVVAGVAWNRRALWHMVPRLVLADLTTLAVATSPILAILSHIYASDGYVDRWIEPPTLFEVAWLYGRTLMGPHLGVLAPVTVLLQVGLLVAAFLAWRRTGNPLLAALAAMLVVGGTVLPLVSLFRPVLLDRTALFLLAPLTLLVAAGAASLPWRRCLPAAAVLVALHAVSTWRWHETEVRKERWDLAMAQLSPRLSAGERLVLTEGALMEFAVRHHLPPGIAGRPPVLVLVPDNDLDRLAARELAAERIVTTGELCHIAQDGASLWLVTREMPELVRTDPAFTMVEIARAALRTTGGRLTESIAVPGALLERWTVGAC